jgi:hypothetical protein
MAACCLLSGFFGQSCRAGWRDKCPQTFQEGIWLSPSRSVLCPGLAWGQQPLDDL